MASSTTAASSSSSSSSSSFKIRLSVKCDASTMKKLRLTTATQSNQVVSIEPTMTMGQLMSNIFDIFKVSEKLFMVELYSGFPLKLLHVPPINDGDDDGDEEKQMFLVKSFIRGGENVIVKFCPIGAKAKAKAKASTKPSSRKRPRTTATTITNGADNSCSLSNTDTDSNAAAAAATSSNKRGRPKRAAATAASASFKDVIKEQDKILHNQKEANKRKRTTTSTSKKTTGSAAAVSARRAAAEARAAKANSRRLAALPGGRRLNDENENNDSTSTESTTTPAPSRASKAASAASRGKTIAEKSVQSIFKGMTSEDDISFALLSSVGAPGGRKMSKVLRYAMRRTVEKSYEQSRAVVRCSAITSGDITFIPHQQAQQLQGTLNECGTFTVQYPKGIEGVGYFRDEQIHIISLETLRAVVQSVYVADDDEGEKGEEYGTASSSSAVGGGKEMLKPTNMAQLSPRVFWSLWFHYKDKSSSIEGALELLLPQLNWKFLHARSRQLSEKAKENLRQEEEGKGKVTDVHTKLNGQEGYEASVEAVKAVEEAMENMYERNSAESIRARAAQAALDRMTRSRSSNHDAKLEWKVETPTESDIDELQECLVEAMGFEDENEKSKQIIDACAQFLISSCSINNWRMLANVTIEDLYSRLSQPPIFPQINETIVAAMITAAQERSMEEIMLEILDGNEEVFHILREEACSATPQDLALWQLAPLELLEEAPALISDQMNVSEENVIIWSSRAKTAIEQFGWLNLYSTSISST